MIGGMRVTALALLVGLTLAACGSGRSSSSATTSSTPTTVRITAAPPWRGLRSVRVTLVQPGLPPPYGRPQTRVFSNRIQLERVTAALNQYQIAERVPPSSNHGCAGGMQITVTIVRQQGPPVNLNGYRCGGLTTGNAEGDLVSFLNALPVVH
jgi:hypothetical protein